MQTTLRLAAIYNLIWGASVILFPSLAFDVLSIPVPADLSIWQGMGMVIGVYGIGYWLASYDPIRHWPIVAVGFLGKVFGPLGYVFNVLQDKISPAFGWMLIPNDLIWWIPFGLILWKVHQQNWPLK